MGTVLMIGGFFAIVLVLGSFAMYFDKKRTTALEAFAKTMGFSFLVKAETALLGPTGSFDLFSHGHSRKIKNLIQGIANGIDLKIFDYQYTTGGGKNSHTYTQTVILISSDRLNLPEFSMRPENFFHKIGEAFGYQDIDFDRNPEFSKRYLLRGPDEKSVREAFTRDALAYFERNTGLCMEAAGGSMIFYRPSAKVAPDGMPALLEQGFAVFGFFAGAPRPAAGGGVKIRMPV